MKSLKMRLVVSVALLLLLTTIIIMLVRHKKPLTQSLVQQERYPHQHLNSSQWEPRAKLNTAEYKLRKNETLASVARMRYGHQKYSSVIKVYNRIADETHIEADTTLRVPDISAILAEEGVTKIAPKQVELILCSRAKYDMVVDQLWALHRLDGSFAVPENIRRQLLEAADDLQQATADLKLSMPGVNKAPASLIGQLEQNMEQMRELAGGRVDSNGYDIDIVQQRYGLALTYAIIWAREGFR